MAEGVLTFFQLDSKEVILNSSRATNRTPKYVCESIEEARPQTLPRCLGGALQEASIPAPLWSFLTIWSTLWNLPLVSKTWFPVDTQVWGECDYSRILRRGEQGKAVYQNWFNME